MDELHKSFRTTLSFISLSFLMVMLSVSCSSNTQDSESDVIHLELGQLDAVQLMEKSVLINKSGDFQKGFEYLNQAVDLDPKAHLGYRGWIRLRKLRDFDQALLDFNRLDDLTLDFIDAPWGEDIDFLRGECHFGNGNYKQAIKSFNYSVSNHGEKWVDLQTFVYLGLCEMELANYQNAIAKFNQALAQSNNVCEAHFGLAKSYQQLGELEKAEKHTLLAESTFIYKRDDLYNEFLNEIYFSEIIGLKKQLISQYR